MYNITTQFTLPNTRAKQPIAIQFDDVYLIDSQQRFRMTSNLKCAN